jgi:hypothetical protein
MKVRTKYWIRMKEYGENFYRIFITKFKTVRRTCSHGDENKVIQGGDGSLPWYCCLRCKTKSAF